MIKKNLGCLIIVLVVTIINCIIYINVPTKKFSYDFTNVSRVDVVLNGNRVDVTDKQEMLLDFFTNVKVYKLGHRRIKNTAAYIYVYMFDESDTLVNEFWVYGDGSLIDNINSNRYSIKESDLNKLLGLVENY